MIWFFLMGMIAGGIGVIMWEMWWLRKHSKRVTRDEMVRELNGEESEKGND